VFAEEDTRWRIARHLLHDGAITTADRVAGLLVLLYCQPVTRIVSLTTDNIVQTNDEVQLLLGRQPLTVPNPLDTLLLELAIDHHGTDSPDNSDEQRWLFPGRLSGQALHPLVMGKRLMRLGIHSRIARNTALMESAATMPAVVLSSLLGLSITAAVRWAALAGAAGNAYAANIIHRHGGEKLHDRRHRHPQPRLNRLSRPYPLGHPATAAITASRTLSAPSHDAGSTSTTSYPDRQDQS